MLITSLIFNAGVSLSPELLGVEELVELLEGLVLLVEDVSLVETAVPIVCVCVELELGAELRLG